jgi:large-conductance mechanosensitive channel
MVGQIMDLAVAIVAGSNAIVSLSCQNLLELYLTVGPTRIRITGLQKAAATATAEVV